MIKSGRGNRILAQIAGAVVNIVLNPILIFGYLEIPEMGIAGAALATVLGQYIFGLNLILAGFSDQAVTTLGLYYKWQTFFFIPLGFLFYDRIS